MGTTIYPAKKSFNEQLSMPTALKKEMNVTVSARSGAVPTIDGDGSYFVLPTSKTISLFRYSASASVDWELAYDDIDASCDGFSGVFWYDTTDGAIWVWAVDTDTTPDTYYLAKVDPDSMAITNVGTCQPTNSRWAGTTFYNSFTERAAMGSGDFTIRSSYFQIVISSADGSIVTSESIPTQNGRTIPTNSSYQTESGDIIVLGSTPNTYNTDDTGVYIDLLRGGYSMHCRIPESSPYVYNGSYCLPMLWAGYVSFFGYGITANAQFFERAAIDAWLRRVCDYYGMPE